MNMTSTPITKKECADLRKVFNLLTHSHKPAGNWRPLSEAPKLDGEKIVVRDMKCPDFVHEATCNGSGDEYGMWVTQNGGRVSILPTVGWEYCTPSADSLVLGSTAFKLAATAHLIQSFPRLLDNLEMALDRIQTLDIEATNVRENLSTLRARLREVYSTPKSGPSWSTMDSVPCSQTVIALSRDGIVEQIHFDVMEDGEKEWSNIHGVTIDPEDYLGWLPFPPLETLNPKA